MLRRIVALSLVVAFPVRGQGTALLRHPTIRGNVVAFAHGGDLWVAARTGGSARRITSTPEVEADPQLSPDGSMIAFTRTIGGNTDGYVVATAGGEPRRLTWHPGMDRVRGWTRDGKRVLFVSDRTSAPQLAYQRLYTVAAAGGVEEPLPMPRAFNGDLSPDGRRIAYEEISQVFVSDWYEASSWQRYRGGRTQPVRIMDLATNSVEKLPWTNSNDRNAMWVGSTIYFLSDRAGPSNLYSYDVGTKAVRQLTHHADAEIMNASADADAIVYEQAGRIHLFDVNTGQARTLSIDVVGDFPWARPQFKRVASLIRGTALSPTGARIALEARGEIFTVPADKGDARNLTRTTGAHEAYPAWSPDGAQVAWLSDASGEWQVMIGDQAALAKPRVLALPGGGTAYFSGLQWAPGGKQLTVEDNHLHLWLIDAASGRSVRIDAETYSTPGRSFDATWSPDSRWVAYTKSLDSHLRAVFVYSVADARSHQITDGMADAVSPAFDASGRYLYFLASTDYGPRTGWVEMSAVDRPVRRAIYLAVLGANEPSPLLPEAGDEPTAPAPPTTPAAAAPRLRPDSVHIDVQGIGHRILALNVPAGDYSALTAGPAGTVYYLEPMPAGGPAAGARLQRFQLKERAPSALIEGVRSYTVSADRKKLLYQAGGATPRMGVVPSDKPARVGDGAIDVAQLEAWVDPRAEWAEIFRETWRIQREFFYDPKMQGSDWKAVFARYGALLPFVDHRADLGYLIAQTGGELTVGHSYLTGRGDEPTETPVSVGLLGADYAIENGAWRFRKIYTGESWNPELRAPLSAPGIHVAEGDYLLEVNGRPLTAATNVYSLFEQTAGRQTVVRIGTSPSAEGSRLVTVVPVASEDGLRTRAWIEDNRRRVDELSGGRLAYVWLPNTSTPGYTAFTRYFYAQQDKEGAIIDERYNHGGLVADYIVNELDRKLAGYFAMRDGKPFSTPAAGIFGPKVMIINESAGSGGDALPYMFQQRKIGPLVGTRTWGGLVGTTGVPPTIDGGGITAPGLAFYDAKGQWRIENEGVSPDVEVEYSAADVIKGHDPQLERAVKEALRLLERDPVRRAPRPAPIDRQRP